VLRSQHFKEPSLGLLIITGDKRKALGSILRGYTLSGDDLEPTVESISNPGVNKLFSEFKT